MGGGNKREIRLFFSPSFFTPLFFLPLLCPPVSGEEEGRKKSPHSFALQKKHSLPVCLQCRIPHSSLLRVPKPSRRPLHFGARVSRNAFSSFRFSPKMLGTQTKTLFRTSAQNSPSDIFIHSSFSVRECISPPSPPPRNHPLARGLLSPHSDSTSSSPATSYSDGKRRERGLFRLWLLPSLLPPSAGRASLPTGRDGVICHCLVLITPLLLLLLFHPFPSLVFCAGSETKLVPPLPPFPPTDQTHPTAKFPRLRKEGRRLIFMGGGEGGRAYVDSARCSRIQMKKSTAKEKEGVARPTTSFSHFPKKKVFSSLLLPPLYPRPREKRRTGSCKSSFPFPIDKGRGAENEKVPLFLRKQIRLTPRQGGEGGRLPHQSVSFSFLKRDPLPFPPLLRSMFWNVPFFPFPFPPSSSYSGDRPTRLLLLYTAGEGGLSPTPATPSQKWPCVYREGKSLPFPSLPPFSRLRCRNHACQSGRWIDGAARGGRALSLSLFPLFRGRHGFPLCLFPPPPPLLLQKAAASEEKRREGWGSLFLLCLSLSLLLPPSANHHHSTPQERKGALPPFSPSAASASATVLRPPLSCD